MGFFRYWCLVLQMAWTHSLGRASDVILSLVILLGLSTFFVPTIHMGIDVNGWQIAAIVLGCIVGLRLLVAPYWIHKSDKAILEELRSKLADRRDRKKIREQLGLFVLEGKALMTRCEDESKPSPESDVTAWSEKVKTFLTDQFELSYIARFENVGMNPIAISAISDKQRGRMWAGIRFRISNIEQFIRENLN